MKDLDGIAQPLDNLAISQSESASSESVPRRILALRTTTLLLSQLQNTQNPTYKQHRMTREQSKEVKIADAFACVASAGHDVAISTHRAPSGLTVLVVTEDDEGTSEEDTPMPEASTKKETTNKEPEPAMKNSEHPVIVSPTPLVLGDQTLESYLHDLRAQWVPLNLRTHLWVVGQLTVKLGIASFEPFENFMKYTIGTHHPKIYRRFEHPWSSIYYQRLEYLKEIPCDNIPECDSTDSHNRYRTQYASDHDFMAVLQFIHKNQPSSPGFSLMPKLIKIFQDLPERGKPFVYYTSDTCTEFHLFLCYLLKRFRTCIDDLHSLTHPGIRDFTKSQSEQPIVGPPNIQASVSGAFLIGYTLWKMARSRAFEIHMQNIQPLLCDPRALSPTPPSTPPPRSDQDAYCNEDLQTTAISIDADGPMFYWKAYRDWVLLIVGHFEAVFTLKNFIRSPLYDHQPISIKIILPGKSEVDHEILPLNDFFASDFFPGDETYNQKIGNFVQNALSLKEQYDNCLSALTSWNDLMLMVDSPEFTRKQIYDAINSKLALMTSTDPSQRLIDLVAEIKKLLFQWFYHPDIIKEGKHDDIKFLPLSQLIADIPMQIQMILDYLAEELEDYGPVPNLQLSFQGTLHCEAYLAALLDPRVRQSLAGNKGFKKVMDATLDFGHIIGVSKHSCLVCQHFLSLLSPYDRFITRGSHSRVTPCNLPEWVDIDAVGQMNTFFGDLLRTTLVQQMNFQAREEMYRESMELFSDLSFEDYGVPSFANVPDIPFQ